MEYLEIAKSKLQTLRALDNYYILAIESSCDETAVAITRNTEIVASVISSQIDIHKRFGGVVPEIASRNHILAIDNLVKEAFKKANLTFNDISVIAVTYGAGLLGALLVGVAYAKALAYALQLPLIAINHVKSHVFANFIAHKDLQMPFMCLLVSGGHTEILEVKSYHDIEILGSTLDDAVGEAFDKVARVLGFSYPGGPEIEKHAKLGKNCISLPRAFKGEKHFNFSYSGLKTAVLNYVNTLKLKGQDIPYNDIACSFQTEAVAVLVEKAIRACKKNNYNKLCIAGGVAANGYLRNELDKAGKKHNIEIIAPPKYLCTDNAAMVGVAGYFAIKEGIGASDLYQDADARA
ncbi:MAG: tRNA (adenosine(37)-N6)-threonylcarbamoyltransferase complex transferase subunit TsaD [Clostridiales bacterium]|nr:tRNA (adenosine(37)-N6)-threonylcarbamoyltransferase complex transferase subunit TsaD [Clostridiales bacterium]